MRITLIAGIVIILSTILSTPVEAQLVASCFERAHLLSYLEKKYGEVPIAGGVTNSGGLVEVLTNDNDNTWTIIVSTPDGTSCLVAAGEGWRTRLEPPSPNLGPPA